MLETYKETPIFIPVDITEEAVELLARKLLGGSGPLGTDLEALQGWLLKFGEDSTRLRTSVENFVDWLSDGIPPWAAYRAFMSGHLIALDKNPGVRPVGVGETWRSLFPNIVFKVIGPEVTMACQDDHLRARLKAGINGSIHEVQALWDENLTTKDWGFLLIDSKNAFSKINRVGML